ncbi:MAG: substrate-binding domain-containing protein [Candidatus Hydrogenedentes bacterium]|nr:substrate-binding domain-containing protein [Candidatus Hydrogenedentota bacterium]
MKQKWLVLMAFILAAGCGPAPQPSEPQTSQDAQPVERQKVIGASLLTQSHQFYRDLVAAMEDEAKKHNFILRIQYAEFNGSKQVNQLETFSQQGVDAIIVSPKDSAGIAPAINEVRADAIPVFTVDIAAHNADVVSHIASDNVLGGRLIGEYLAKLLNGKGKVAIIDQPETASVQERVAGFEEALSKFPEISIVQRAPGGGVRDKAMRAAQDVLQANPDLNAIFGINDDSALGALAALESAGLQDKVFIVGYDGTPEAREAILNGTALKADTVQHPTEIGREAIQIIAKYFAGEEVPKIVPVRVDIIDKTSLEAEQQG